ncbi:MAG: alcohol dehydrogenase catalytic domain-containing protein [Gemmatimonadota bacterium]
MKAITFQGVESVAYGDVAEPAIGDPGDALVEVTAAGLCGSDLHPYFGRESGIDRGTVMGHEFVGRVLEVGGAVRDIAVGDRVVAPFTTSCGACFYCGVGLTARCERGQLFGWVTDGRGLQGAQAERVRVPLADGTLVHVPDAVADDAVAVLAGDILSTALFGAELADVRAGAVVAVVGCGPVGVLVVRAALERGAAAVFAVDRVPSRLALAARFGAVPVDLNEADATQVILAQNGGRGADCAIEAVGGAEATRTAADLLRAGGNLAAIGVHTEPYLAISPGELYDRNLHYAAGRSSARHFLPRALALAARDGALLAELISHRLPLSNGAEAYRRFGARDDGWTKVVFVA